MRRLSIGQLLMSSTNVPHLARLKQAVRNPNLVGFAIKDRINKAVALAQQRRFGVLTRFVLAGVSGNHVLDSYLSRSVLTNGSGEIGCHVGEHWMILDPTDEGISRTLRLFGVHERGPTTAYRSALEAAAGQVADPVVIDVGANIGYFVLHAAAATRPAGSIYAFEPDPRNLELLHTNVRTNGYEQRVTIESKAIGATSGTRELGLSRHSNLNRILEDGRRPSRDTGEAITVKMSSIDSYVTDHEIDPASVAGIRMDLEGFEAEVFEGMETVLAAAGPTVLFVEMHPWVLGDRHGTMLSRLAGFGFELHSAQYGVVYNRPFPMTIDAERLVDLRHVPEAYALIAIKPASPD